MQEIISRKDAASKGLSHYFTGKPCKRGHLCQRFVVGYACVECRPIDNKEWHEKNADKVSKRKKIYISKVGEKRREYVRNYYKTNRDACLKRRADWAKNNPEANRARTSRRRARLRQTGGSHTAQDVKNILKMQKGRCANCRARLSEFHIDHVMPIRRGGSDDWRNLQILCPLCNHKKHAKHPIDWALENGRLV